MRKAVGRSLGLAFTVPEVVFHRTARMWLAGALPSRRDRDEFYRMWAEKPAAFFQSWNAMVLEMHRANFDLAMRIWAAGLGPIHRRATANAKRLRRGR